jgi:hypothetical protein
LEPDFSCKKQGKTTLFQVSLRLRWMAWELRLTLTG